MRYIENNLFLLCIISALIPILLMSSNTVKEREHSLEVKNSRVKPLKKESYISDEYFKNIPRCSPSCGVAITGWYNAKKYCYQKNSRLVSKQEVKKYTKKKDSCLDCNYWTSTEALLTKRKNQKQKGTKKVVIYLNFEDHFLDYPIDNTYIATCLSN